MCSRHFPLFRAGGFVLPGSPKGGSEQALMVGGMRTPLSPASAPLLYDVQSPGRRSGYSMERFRRRSTCADLRRPPGTAWATSGGAMGHHGDGRILASTTRDPVILYEPLYRWGNNQRDAPCRLSLDPLAPRHDAVRAWDVAPRDVVGIPAACGRGRHNAGWPP